MFAYTQYGSTFTATSRIPTESPTIAPAYGDGFIVTYADRSAQSPFDFDIYAWKFDAFGAPLSYLLGDTGTTFAPYPAAIGAGEQSDPDSGFLRAAVPGSPGFFYQQPVSVFTSTAGADASGTGIRALIGGQGSSWIANIQVNTSTAGDQNDASLAVLNGGTQPLGSFAVAWTDAGGADADVRAQLIRWDGVKIGGEITLNTTTAGAQDHSVLAPLSNGYVVAAWQDASQSGADTSGTAIRARVWNTSTGAMFDEFLVNAAATTGDQTGVKIAALSMGGFVAVWLTPGASAGQINLVAQKFAPQLSHANGFVAMDAAKVIDTQTAGSIDITDYMVLGDRTGGYVVVHARTNLANNQGALIATQVEFQNNSEDDTIALTTAPITTIDATYLNDGRTAFTWKISGAGIQGSIWDNRGAELHGTAGDDYIVGADSGAYANNVIIGSDGKDQLYGMGGNDSLWGEGGDDGLGGGAGNDVLVLGDGADQGLGGSGNDYVYGGAGNDVMYGDGVAGPISTTQVDVLIGQDGDDTAYGGEGQDYIYGDDGNDSLQGNGGVDVLIGGAGGDFLYGNLGSDYAYGGDGNDTIYGGTLLGGALIVDGNDILVGEAGDDKMYGGGENDYLYGGDGNDQLFGGYEQSFSNFPDGVDVLLGEAGNDILDGGTGVDYYGGGAGNDLFVVRGGGGTKVIYDFTPGGTDDSVVLINSGFTSVAQIQAATLDQGSYIIIPMPNGDSIWMFGVHANQFTSADFIFN